MSERYFSFVIIIRKHKRKGNPERRIINVGNNEVSTVLELVRFSRLRNKGVVASSSRLTIVERAREEERSYSVRLIINMEFQKDSSQL